MHTGQRGQFRLDRLRTPLMKRWSTVCAYRKSHSAVFTNVTLLHCTQNLPQYKFARDRIRCKAPEVAHHWNEGRNPRIAGRQKNFDMITLPFVPGPHVVSDFLTIIRGARSISCLPIENQSPSKAAS